MLWYSWVFIGRMANYIENIAYQGDQEVWGSIPYTGYE